MTGKHVSDDDVQAMLSAEAADVEARRDRGEAGGPLHAAAPPRDPAQVYTLRVPVHALDRLRRVAALAAVTPTALMRAWVLDRLEQETSGRAIDRL